MYKIKIVKLTQTILFRQSQRICVMLSKDLLFNSITYQGTKDKLWIQNKKIKFKIIKAKKFTRDSDFKSFMKASL